MPEPTRLPRLLALIAVLTLAVAACGGAASPEPSGSSPADATATPTSAATETAEPPDSAEPGGGGADVGDAAAALDDLRKYQIDVNIAGFMPAASGASSITMTAVIDRDNEAIDLSMAGVEGLPTAGATFHVIVIGSDAWLDLGTGTFIAQPGGGGSFETMAAGFEPQAILSELPASAYAGLQEVGNESKNGVEATHYHVDSSVQDFADALGPDGEAEIWIAVDGGYMVSMTMSGTTDVDGTPTPIEMAFDVTRINDSSIDIQPPS